MSNAFLWDALSRESEGEGFRETFCPLSERRLLLLNLSPVLVVAVSAFVFQLFCGLESCVAVGFAERHRGERLAMIPVLFPLVVHPLVALVCILVMIISCGGIGEDIAGFLVFLNFALDRPEGEGFASFSGRGPGEGEDAGVTVGASLGSHHVVDWLSVEVTAKTRSVAAVVHGQQNVHTVGDLDSRPCLEHNSVAVPFVNDLIPVVCSLGLFSVHEE